MISPAPETRTKYQSFKVVEGREGSSHQQHLSLHSLAGPVSAELLLEFPRLLFPQERSN